MKQIPPFRLVPQPLNDEARNLPAFRWAEPPIGSRHQLGGEPTFVQTPEWPACPTCHQPMTFYGQLDSINDDYAIADCGLVYVFLCFDDFQAQAVVQSG